MFPFSVFHGKYPFGQIWSQNSKFSAYAETWYLDYFEYAQFNGDLNFFHFAPEILILGKLSPKIQNCQIQLKRGK